MCSTCVPNQLNLVSAVALFFVVELQSSSSSWGWMDYYLYRAIRHILDTPEVFFFNKERNNRMRLFSVQNLFKTLKAIKAQHDACCFIVCILCTK